MPRPVRSLSVLQNWDCQSCGDCCKSYHVRVSASESARIHSQGWEKDPELMLVPLTIHDKKMDGERLNHKEDGSCVFLDDKNRCKIHAKHGEAAKPLACRIYPYVMVPVGDHWRVSLRYACPAVSENVGRPLVEHQRELKEFAQILEAEPQTDFEEAATPPELQAGQSVDWNDLIAFTKAINSILADISGSIELRLRQVLALSSLCRKSRFESVQGRRLAEFLELISSAFDDDVVDQPAGVPPPSWVGRMIFRQLAAIYCRRDYGPYAGVGSHGRWSRLRAAWRFATGRGKVPRLHALMPETTFAAIEKPLKELSLDTDALLTRYYRVKIESLQFCGTANYHFKFWEGLDALLLTYPATMWLARVLHSDGALTADEAVSMALRIVDDNFAYNPLLGTNRQKWAVARLSDRGEIAKLIAWYGQ